MCSTGGIILKKETKVLGGKPIPMSLSSPQKPHGIA